MLSDHHLICRVPVTVNGGPAEPEVKKLPKHKKNAEVGEKQTVFSSHLLIEQEDAVSFEDNEEVQHIQSLFVDKIFNMPVLQITLMDWGNAIVRSKTIDASGKVTSMIMDLHLNGDFRKTKKKITWLSAPTSADALVEVTLLDHDYLITKKKLEENDDVKDFVTPVSEFREDATADANVTDLNKGDIIQFERKGYYIFDGISKDGRREFVHIPDGRAASLASKAGASSVSAAPAVAESSKTQSSSAPAIETSMYEVDKVYGDDAVIPVADTKMYKVQNVYE